MAKKISYVEKQKHNPLTDWLEEVLGEARVEDAMSEDEENEDGDVRRDKE